MLEGYPPETTASIQTGMMCFNRPPYISTKAQKRSREKDRNGLNRAVAIALCTLCDESTSIPTMHGSYGGRKGAVPPSMS